MMVVVVLSMVVDDDRNRTPTLTRGLTLWLVGIILNHDDDDDDDDSRYAQAGRLDETLDDGVRAFDGRRENATAITGRL